MQIVGVIINSVDPLPDGSHGSADVSSNLLLHVAVADRAVIPFLFKESHCVRSANQPHQSKEVLDDLRLRRIRLGRTAVSYSPHHFLCDGLVVLIEVYAVTFALTHLAAAVQAGNLHKVVAEIESLRLGEHIHAVHVVETAGEQTGNLQMLLLVLAHRHILRAVDEDVRSHQHRIGQKTGVDIVGLQTHLVLERSSALHLALVCQHVQQNIKLRHLRHVTLHVEGALLGVETCSQVFRKNDADRVMEVRRMRVGCQRMKVCNKEIALVCFLNLDEVSQRPEVVAKMEMAGRAYAAENDIHCKY